MREKLSTTEKITDHYLTDSGIIYSAVDQIDLLDPAPPFIQFFDPSAKVGTNFSPCLLHQHLIKLSGS